MSEMHVTFFGLGYIGLPTAALVASKRIRVKGVDTKQEVVEIINRGQVHIIEPDLEGLVRSVVDRQYLTAHTQPQESNVYIIAVPTPVRSDKRPDISSIEAVIDILSPLLKPENLVIIESTSPVGTTEAMYKRIIALRPDLEGKFYMAYCPERVLPGNVLHELEYNDRVVGGIDPRSAEVALNFYRLFVKGQIFTTTSAIAEMCKLTENAYRDVNIAFANELSIIADKAGIDVTELISLANRHPRVNILNPGVGVGGHCIAIDPWFIISEFPDEAKLMRSARQLNDGKRDWVISKIIEYLSLFESQSGKKPTVACYGLAYKPDIDDLRESPALFITQQLMKSGVDILAVEPHINGSAGLQLVTMEAAIASADIHVFLVKHKLFMTLPVQEHELDFCGLRTEQV